MGHTIEQLFRDRSVLVTGHTGFKGSWLCLWLVAMGAKVTGFSDRVPTAPGAFDLMALGGELTDRRGDIVDAEKVLSVITAARPSVIFHLAAQPIVRQGFKQPYETFAANVLGTVSVLEAARKVPSVRAVVVVTSDKVYHNNGAVRRFRETDALGGHEPYGASKAAAEIVTMAYRSEAFHEGAQSPNRPAIAAARAGNVIGGGDWAADRLIPDLVRAIADGRDQEIRQPSAIRPWQHVLEPIGGYLCLAGALIDDPASSPAAVNFGPNEMEPPDVAQIATLFLDAMPSHRTRLLIREKTAGEATTLRVDSGLALRQLSWRPGWNTREAIARTADWYRAWLERGTDMRRFSLEQLESYRRSTPVPALRASAPMGQH